VNKNAACFLAPASTDGKADGAVLLKTRRRSSKAIPIWNIPGTESAHRPAFILNNTTPYVAVHARHIEFILSTRQL
jgi:hypothetical protein